ncbi:MAG: O-antigen ligase family protein [Candidatus Hodarchaeota archaeon]
MLGRLVLNYPLDYGIFLILGMSLLLIVYQRPMFGIALLLILLTFAKMMPEMPLVGIGIGTIAPQDILLIFLLTIIPLRWLLNNKIEWVKTPLNIPMTLFFLAALLSALVAYFKFEVDFHLIRRELRHFAYYLVFFIVINNLQNKNHISLLFKVIIGMALFSCLCSISKGFFNYSLPWVADLGAIGLQESPEVMRIGFPGAEVIYIAIIVLISLVVLIKDKRKIFFFIMLMFPIIIALILAYTRHIWISMSASLVLFFLMVPRYNKYKMFKCFGVVLLILLLIFAPLILYQKGKFREYGFAAIRRMGTIFTQELWKESNTMHGRYVENRYAWEKIKRYPILGIGLANEFRPKLYKKDSPRGLHNAYLYLWLYFGLPGLLLFLWMSALFISRGFKIWKKPDDPFLRAMIIGFSLSYFGMMISNMVAPFFVQSWRLAIFGTIMGVNEVIYKIEGPAERSSLHSLSKLNTSPKL